MPWFALPLLTAPFVGSFLGVMILRLPRQQPVAWARSACANCGTRLAARDLVPVASFAALRGRCRHCGGAIGWFHPAVELAATGVAAWAVLVGDMPEQVWITCLLGWTLLSLAWIDAQSFLLPDVLTLPLLVAGLLVASANEPNLLLWHAIGAACGYLALQGIALAYRRFRGLEGLGGGDAKLVAAAGAWMGVNALPGLVLLAAVLGLAWAGLIAARGRRIERTTAVPFGPFLATSFWILWLYGGRWGLA